MKHFFVAKMHGTGFYRTTTLQSWDESLIQANAKKLIYIKHLHQKRLYSYTYIHQQFASQANKQPYPPFHFHFFGYLFSEIHIVPISWGAYGGVCLVADQAVTATTAETMSFTGCSLVGSHSKTSSFFFSHFCLGVSSFFKLALFFKVGGLEIENFFLVHCFEKKSMVIMGFLCKSSRTWWISTIFSRTPGRRFFEDLFVDLTEVLETTYKAFIYVEAICPLMGWSFIAPFFA